MAPPVASLCMQTLTSWLALTQTDTFGASLSRWTPQGSVAYESISPYASTRCTVQKTTVRAT